VALEIEEILKIPTISPCEYVAQRTKALLLEKVNNRELQLNSNDEFNFCSSQNNQWVVKNRQNFLHPFSL